MMMLHCLKMLDSRLDNILILQSKVVAVGGIDTYVDATTVTDEMKLERISAVKVAECIPAISSYLIGDPKLGIIRNDIPREDFIKTGIQSIRSHIEAARFESISLPSLTFKGNGDELSEFVRKMVIESKNSVTDYGFACYGNDKFAITIDTIPRIAIFVLGECSEFQLGFKYIYDSSAKVFEIHMNRGIDKHIWPDSMLYIERVLGLIDVVDTDRRNPENRLMDYGCFLNSITNLYIPPFERVYSVRTEDDNITVVQNIGSFHDKHILSVDTCYDTNRTLSEMFWMCILGLYMQITPTTGDEIEYNKKSIREYLTLHEINDLGVVHMFTSYDGHEISYIISILESESGTYSILCLDSYSTNNTHYDPFELSSASNVQCVNYYDPRYTAEEKSKCKQREEREIIHINRGEISARVRESRAAARIAKTVPTLGQLQKPQPPLGPSI